MDIYSTAPITFVQAALGGDVRIKTVDGEVEYTVKPGTQTDTRVRLRGKGVPSLRNKSIRGDHYVTLVVEVPTKMNGEQKELLQQFGKAMYGDTDEKENKANTEESGTKKKSPFGKNGKKKK
jgi:molecular chaperone DnaJ